MTLSEIWTQLKSWKAAATTVITALAATVAWLSGQVTTLRGTIDDLHRPTITVRQERAAYLVSSKEEFARDDDPRKSGFLNDIVYRVRMETMPAPVGADLLCWLAAKADAAQPDVGAVDGRTTNTVIAFLDQNRDVFPLTRRTASAWPFMARSESVDAATYCGPYLSTQRDPVNDPASAAVMTQARVSTQRGAAVVTASAANTPLRLFAHIADENQRASAQDVALALATQFPRIAYQGTERISGYTGPNEVRYYKPADAGAAQVVSNRLRCDGERPPAVPVRGYETNSLVRPGTLELWIPKGVGACVLLPAPPAG